MYNSFYNLKENPFRLTPDPAFMFMTPQHREALAGLVYSACTRPGLTVLVGEAGTGKTTLLYTLIGLLEKRRFVTALCNNPTLTRQEFYDLVIMKLGVECASSLKSRQLVALQEHLLQRRTEGRPAVLIVDEAQRLSTELLEEIRLLLNLETPREKLLEIIIAGQPELTDILRRAEMRQFKQRVSCVCRLKPLSYAEVHGYLQHRLARAGLPEQKLFSEDSIQAIYEYTHGIPRLVNSLCDSALQTGFALQSPRITVSIIRDAAKDLDLLHPGRVEQAPDADSVFPADGVELGEESAAVPVQAVAGKANGAEVRIPLEANSTRQRTLNFFGNFIDRWR